MDHKEIELASQRWTQMGAGHQFDSWDGFTYNGLAFAFLIYMGEIKSRKIGMFSLTVRVTLGNNNTTAHTFRDLTGLPDIEEFKSQIKKESPWLNAEAMGACYETLARLFKPVGIEAMHTMTDYDESKRIRELMHYDETLLRKHASPTLPTPPLN